MILMKLKEEFKKIIMKNQEAIELLSCLNRDRISIDDIHELKYVALRFGKLPLSQIEKLNILTVIHLFLSRIITYRSIFLDCLW